MATKVVRAWWVRSIIANLVGFAFLVIGWFKDSDILIGAGLLLMLGALAVRTFLTLRAGR
jgi:hypothetical protein